MTSPCLWNHQELRQATQGTLLGEVSVHDICIDTRTLKKGDLFIALIGHNSDGHRFIRHALELGASCVIAHDKDTIADFGLTHDPRLLLVRDTMEALKNLGHYARQRFQGTMFAITGSVGKTTTKNMLHRALSAYGKTHASAASFNNHWGVPLTLSRLPRDAHFCICEVGMNHPGEIMPLAQQIRPHIALITTIGSAHLGNMGSIETIAQEKASLFTSLHGRPSIALAPSSAQHNILCHALPPNSSLWSIGTEDTDVIILEKLSCTHTGSTFMLSTPHETISISLTAPGAHLAHNAALTLGAISALQLPLYKAAAALNSFQPEAGRGLQKTLSGNVILIDESYNASGPSVRAALETLALMPAPRHIAALGDILELGHFASQEHCALSKPLIEHNILTFCCGTHMKTLFDALPPSLQGGYAPTAELLAPILQKSLKPHDTLLVKGSLGSRMRDIITHLTSPTPQDTSVSS